MATSSRFAISVHVLSLMAGAHGDPVKSEYAAGSVNTNPVVIRRILSALARAGIVSTQPGGTGGSRLVRSPEEITLLDVYRAVEPGDLFAMHRHPPNPKCPVGLHIQKVLAGALDKAQAAMENQLAATTLAQIMQALQTEIGYSNGTEHR
jgi:Rrf2 family protein